MYLYSIKLIKIYKFDLDGKSKEEIIEQMNYIQNNLNVLDIPEVKKKSKLKIQKKRLSNLYKKNNY